MILLLRCRCTVHGARCRVRLRRCRVPGAACRVLGVRPRPKFGHGVEVQARDDLTIVCCFHPSQQNTFTGKLTPEMIDAVLGRARELADGAAPRAAGAPA